MVLYIGCSFCFSPNIVTTGCSFCYLYLTGMILLEVVLFTFHPNCPQFVLLNVAVFNINWNSIKIILLFRMFFLLFTLIDPPPPIIATMQVVTTTEHFKGLKTEPKRISWSVQGDQLKKSLIFYEKLIFKQKTISYKVCKLSKAKRVTQSKLLTALNWQNKPKITCIQSTQMQKERSFRKTLVFKVSISHEAKRTTSSNYKTSNLGI